MDDGFICADADANLFITNANITDLTQKEAICTLVAGLKSNGIWSKMKAIYPFVGGTASQHKFNLKNPLDTDLAYRLDFNGVLTHSSTGVKGDGITGYADTFFIGDLNNVHISIYIPNNTASNGGIEMGARDNTFVINFTQLNVSFTDGNLYGGAQTTLFSPLSNSNSQGFYLTSRLSSSQYVNYKNSSKIQTISSASTNIVDYSMYIGARNENGVLPSFFSDREFSFATAGEGLNDTESLNLYNIIQTFQTTLGRNI